MANGSEILHYRHSVCFDSRGYRRNYEFWRSQNFQDTAMLETFCHETEKGCDVQTVAVLEHMCLCISCRNGATVSLLWIQRIWKSIERNMMITSAKAKMDTPPWKEHPLFPNHRSSAQCWLSRVKTSIRFQNTFVVMYLSSFVSSSFQQRFGARTVQSRTVLVDVFPWAVKVDSKTNDFLYAGSCGLPLVDEEWKHDYEPFPYKSVGQLPATSYYLLQHSLVALQLNQNSGWWTMHTINIRFWELLFELGQRKTRQNPQDVTVELVIDGIPGWFPSVPLT